MVGCGSFSSVWEAHTVHASVRVPPGPVSALYRPCIVCLALALRLAFACIVRPCIVRPCIVRPCIVCLAHVTFTGAGCKGSRLVPLPDQSMGPGGLATPQSGRAPAGAPPSNQPLQAFRADGGVVWSSGGAPLAHPVLLLF